MNPAEDLSIAVVLGSTRPGRAGAAVADWVVQRARGRAARYELLDLAKQALPHIDEPIPPAAGRYQHPHTLQWATVIRRYDGYVFVTPEYNHGPSGAPKDALDFVFAEWHDKAAGFVGYGVVGAARAIEHLRPAVSTLGLADVRAEVNLFLSTDFRDRTRFDPAPHQLSALDELLDQVENWAAALQTARRTAPRLLSTDGRLSCARTVPTHPS